MAPFEYGIPSLLVGTAVLSPSRIRDFRDAFLSKEAFFETARHRLSQWGTAKIGSEDLAEATRGLYQMMLDDPTFVRAVSTCSEHDQCSPEDAFRRCLDDLITIWKQNGEYFAQRAYDLEDLYRLVSHPVDHPTTGEFPKDAILLLDTLLTTELAGLDGARVKAVIAGRGGHYSHPAILLRSRGIPLIILNQEVTGVKSGDALEIDLARGTIRVNGVPWKNWSLPAPEKNEIPVMPENIEIWPCISTPEEALGLRMERFGGIGLVRTEMTAILSGRMLSRNEMEVEYAMILRHAGGRPVHFRLWDFEPDKPAPGFPKDIWGLDFLRKYPEWTRRQIDVFLKLSGEYPLGIILPMVRSQIEIDEFSSLLGKAKREMFGPDGEKWPRISLGAMIETREMAEIAGDINGLDFWVIGTNDLCCSLTGRCREDGTIDSEALWDPELIKLIASIAKQANQTKTPLFLCGEGANSPQAIARYSENGIRAFCPSPAGLSAYSGYACNK